MLIFRVFKEYGFIDASGFRGELINVGYRLLGDRQGTHSPGKISREDYPPQQVVEYVLFSDTCMQL